MALPFLELCYLFLFPALHFGSPLPLVPAARLLESAPAHLSRDAHNPDAADGFPVEIVFASRWSDSDRIPRDEGGKQSSAWLSLEENLSEALRASLGVSVRVYFPETFFGVDYPRVVQLFERLEAQLVPSRSEVTSQSLEFYAGVGSSANNRVAWIGRDPLTGMVRVRNLRSKRVLVPFFERSAFGIQLWESDEELRSPWSGLLPFPPGQEPDKSFQILICYEALFPQLREAGRGVVVFGNHHLFGHTGIMSRSFDYAVLLVSQLSRQHTLMVQNYGHVGVATPLWVDPAAQPGKTAWGSARSRSFRSGVLVVEGPGEGDLAHVSE
jgi:hypothetical protein